MLENCSNQAAGLLGLACQPGPRLLAVVNHGDDQAELPLLWQLCLALVNFGCSVTVLDGTTAESPDNPGLAQVLVNSHWRDEPARDAAAWTVLPSRAGLQHLCAAPTLQFQSLQQLGQLFPGDGVVVLYCKAEWMTTLIGNHPIEPLLAVSPVKTSLMTSYVALKRLLISGNLKPTIVNMVQDAESAIAAAPSTVSVGLSDCAKRFLGHDVKTLNIAEHRGEAPQNSDMQRLALRLLESALELRAEYVPMQALGRTKHMGHTQHQGEMH